MTVRFIVLACAALAVGGCAVMSEQDCRYADWYALGATDGGLGRDQGYLSDRARACEKYGEPIDASSWRKGWEVGIRRFCVPEQGFREGRSGYGYSGACPREVEQDFLEGYRLGSRLHAISAEIAGIDALIAEIDEDLAAEDLGRDQRRRLREERRRQELAIRDLEREAGALEATAYDRGFRW